MLDGKSFIDMKDHQENSLHITLAALPKRKTLNAEVIASGRRPGELHDCHLWKREQKPMTLLQAVFSK